MQVVFSAVTYLFQLTDDVVGAESHGASGKRWQAGKCYGPVLLQKEFRHLQNISTANFAFFSTLDNYFIAACSQSHVGPRTKKRVPPDPLPAFDRF
jgi:hypothetical protein